GQDAQDPAPGQGQEGGPPYQGRRGHEQAEASQRRGAPPVPGSLWLPGPPVPGRAPGTQDQAEGEEEQDLEVERLVVRVDEGADQATAPRPRGEPRRDHAAEEPVREPEGGEAGSARD